ncbi:hypothetical protein EV182_003387, partial [Spiromyces aspiralis]
MLELYSWGTIWPDDQDRLISFDPSCHSLITYMRLANIEHGLRTTTDPSISATGELPLLRDGNDLAESGYDHAVQYLKLQGFDLDHELTPRQKAESHAFITMIREHLVDVLA